MHSFVTTTMVIAIVIPNILGMYFRDFHNKPENNDLDIDEIQNDTFNILTDSSEISNNISQYRTDEQLSSETSSNILTTKNDSRTGETKVAFITSSPTPSAPKGANTQSTQLETTLTEIFSNVSNSTSSESNSSKSPSTSTGLTTSNIQSTNLHSTSTHPGMAASSTEDEEQEGVVRGKPSSAENATTVASEPETIYQKALALINDTYTLSILMPVAAGVVFASTIIVTIATCRCLRRQCRRRRLRKKTLPDSVKNLRPSDRARLLAESSDEEF